MLVHSLITQWMFDNEQLPGNEERKNGIFHCLVFNYLKSVMDSEEIRDIKHLKNRSQTVCSQVTADISNSLKFSNILNLCCIVRLFPMILYIGDRQTLPTIHADHDKPTIYTSSNHYKLLS